MKKCEKKNIWDELRLRKKREYLRIWNENK